MTSFDMDVNMSTAFISSFEMELYEPENSLNSGSEPRNSARRRRRISFLKIAKSFWLRSKKSSFSEAPLLDEAFPWQGLRDRYLLVLELGPSLWNFIFIREKMNRRLGSQSNVRIGSYGVLTHPLSHIRRFWLLLFQDPDGRAEALPQVRVPTKLCDHRSGPFYVRTDGGPETFRGRFDAL